MNRRTMLKAVAAAGAAATFPLPFLGAAEENRAWRQRVLRYLESLPRADGGYGWEGQERAHLSPTCFVIGAYHVLGVPVPDRPRVAEFIRTHHPAALKKLEQERRIFDFQQVQALIWLGEDVSILRERITSWKQPVAYLKQYERHGYPLFSSEMGVILAQSLLGVPRDALPTSFTEYLLSRRRENGSFGNTPATDGSDGHVVSTWWGLQALQALAAPAEKVEQTVAWLRSCQLPGGGFTFQPSPAFGGVDDVAYTWAAVNALRQVGAGPADAPACAEYLRSLANNDGGFGDRPGWLSNPMATFYALDALRALGVLEEDLRPSARPAKVATPLPAGLKAYTIQLEAHGQGSPAEAVELARSLRIHLWGAKNAKPGWIARVQALADQRKVPVRFFTSNEEYGTWMDVPGQGTYSHMSDIIGPADHDLGASLAREEAVSWPDFRERRLAALEKAQGRLVWQFGENEELVRMFLDDSVERGGYAAISTYHFGNPDFTNSEPFLHRWRGQIPFVALQDAHGPEPWWFADMTTGFRTVFLATEPTWAGWLNALKNHWVTPVRRDQWTGGKTWMHTPSAAVRDYLKAHEEEWRWWDNPGIERPLVSLVAIRPDDEFESARPEKGVALRIRCAWENNPQGRLKRPITGFVKLIVDGAEFSPQLVAKKRANGLLDEHYHYLPLPELAPGKHLAQVIARVRDTGKELEKTLKFTV